MIPHVGAAARPAGRGATPLAARRGHLDPHELAAQAICDPHSDPPLLTRARPLCRHCHRDVLIVMGLTEPTFEDLAIDESLDDVQRIVRYTSSSIALQRLVYTRMIGSVAKQIGYQRTKELFLPLLPRLAQDPEFLLRHCVAEQLGTLAELFITEGGHDGYAQLVERLLPLLGKLVGDASGEVRLIASQSLVSAAKHVRPDDLGPRVLTMVLELAHDDSSDELRVTATLLLNDLAPLLGVELCRQFVTPEVTSLSQDPQFRVRKAVALSMNHICATVGAEVTENRLVPCFIRLSKDEIWGVRRSCAEGLVALSQAVPEAVRVKELVHVAMTLTEDGNRWVRFASFQNLGPFIATLKSEQVTSQLLSRYTNVTPTDMKGPVPETPVMSLSSYCAFSFPAVVQTVGRDRWGELPNALHEIARVLGPEMSEVELLATFEFFIQKDLDEVRMGVVKHLAEFLGCLSPGCRESYLPVLDEICSSTDPLHWRFRLYLAQQLPALSTLFTIAPTYSVVLPVTITLLRDSVAAVRDEACLAVWPLVRRLGEADPSWRSDFVRRLVEFGSSPHYQSRICFVRMCGLLIMQMDLSMFASYFITHLLRCASDRVRNVRLKVATVMDSAASLPGFFNDDRIVRCCHTLAADTDPEVARIAKSAMEKHKPASTPTKTDTGASSGAAGSASAASTPPQRPANDVIEATRHIATTAAQIAIADAVRRMGTRVSNAVEARRMANAAATATAVAGTA